MKLRLASALLFVALLFAITTSAAAQNYSFRLAQEIVHIFWNSDGTMTIDYTFVFVNDSGAAAIDFVDVGMPNGSFDRASIAADVNGQPVAISSDYQGGGSYGFAVDLGGYAIQPGQTGSVHVRVGRVERVLYPDDNDENYVSGVFTPTWFGSQFVYGNTDLTVVFHLPPGVQPGEGRYHESPPVGWPCSNTPQTALDNQGRVQYTWTCPNANGYTQYTFGASFPKQYVPADAIITSPLPFQPSDIDFRLDTDALMAWLFCCCFVSIFIGAPILSIIGERKRKLQYMPPKISLEGHGIKRGLTAVEAAILMEQPLDKVMTMILFGVVKKGAAEVVQREPLELKVASPLPENLHEYEKNFLAAFTEPTLAARRKALQEMTVKLVKSVSEKMKGFSRRETVEYYKAIMERAWQQIEAAGTPEVKSQMYDEALEWTMLDKDYDERTRRVFTGPVFVPVWWGRYDPAYRPVSTAGAGGAGRVSVPSTSGGGRVSVPGAAFAASVVSSVQSLASRTLGDVKTFTSGVTSRTNPLPKSTSSGGRWSGGGGGCACACACAGCACACAGGGR
ncbi:MAG: hypothetical protein ABWK53_06020 [Anaerolineales bacterium]